MAIISGSTYIGVLLRYVDIMILKMLSTVRRSANLSSYRCCNHSLHGSGQSPRTLEAFAIFAQAPALAGKVSRNSGAAHAQLSKRAGEVHGSHPLVH